MSRLGEDLLGALRRLVRTPGSSAMAVAALAIGIGFSTASYSVADGLLFRPLRIPELDRVVAAAGKETAGPRDWRSLSPADAQALRAARSLESFAVQRIEEFNLTGAGEPVKLLAARVTPGFFDVMKVQPVRGRAFLEEEGTLGKDRVVILSENVWESQFGADPAVIGRDIDLNGKAYRVVGIMARRFLFPATAQVWMPLALTSAEWGSHGNFYLRSVARLRPGVSLEETREELRAIAARMAAEHPDTHSKLTVRVELLRERITGDFTPRFTRITIAFVLFLLLIACLNVANLQFARVLGRTREVAVRGALGAPRARLVFQILSESLVLAFAGAALGILVAQWCLDLTKAAMPPEVERYLPGWRLIVINRWVLLWTALTALAAGIVSGFGPALWLSRAPIAVNLHDAGRSATGGSARRRLRGALVVTEAALSLALLVGATLTVKCFRAIGELPVSTDPARLLTARVALPDSSYASDERRNRFAAGLLARIERIPGVEKAALVTNLPYSGSSNASVMSIEGRPNDRSPQYVAQWQNAGGDYFGTMGIRILRGEGFTGSEGPNTRLVAVVNETFARRYFPGEDPIGRRIDTSRGWTTIIGVSRDILHDYSDRIPFPAMYFPASQAPNKAFSVVLRTAGDPAMLVSGLREAVRSVDPALPLAEIMTFRKLIDDNILGIGYAATIFAVVGLVALLLTVLGTYSLMAWSVGERTREFGVRLALGSGRGGILWMVLRGGAWICALALGIGLPAGMAVSRLLKGVLFGVSSSDPATFTMVPAALVLAIAAACLLPAHRATRTDPLTALRHE
jgi:predicted permease